VTHQTGHLANHTRLATQRLQLGCLDSVRIKTPTSAKSGNGNGEMRAAIMRCAAADRGAGMVQFTIIPRGRGYWIEIVGNDGSRQAVERYDTEDAAIRRLRMLQERAESVEWQSSAMRPAPKTRH
jgi:hypothetical protein